MRARQGGAAERWRGGGFEIGGSSGSLTCAWDSNHHGLLTLAIASAVQVCSCTQEHHRGPLLLRRGLSGVGGAILAPLLSGHLGWCSACPPQGTLLAVGDEGN